MKKFSEKYLYENYKILGKSIIGLEFEFYTNLSYYKLLELLNIALDPVKVHGFKKYHPDFKPDKDNFMITPDLSGGMNMVELITAPLNYFEAKIYLSKILKFIEKYCYTTDKSSIHINISFDTEKYPELDLDDLNVLKFILNVDETYIYEEFPMRKDNIYAKSVLDLIPFKEVDFSKIQLLKIPNIIRAEMEDRYFGVNFQHLIKDNYTDKTKRLEVRYLGGKDYEKKSDVIQDIMDLFVINIHNCINAPIDNFDESLLDKVMSERADMFIDISTYDDFLAEFPDVYLQINQNDDYIFISSMYDKVSEDIKDVIGSAEQLKDGIINFDTATNKIELVNFENLEFTRTIKDVVFVSCTIKKGIFNNCIFNNCEIDNLDINHSELVMSTIKKSRMVTCILDKSCEVRDSFIMESQISCEVHGGVIRSGIITPDAFISKETMVIKEEDNFFGISYNNTADNGSDKKGLKGKGAGVTTQKK